jgi:hypothetical protein
MAHQADLTDSCKIRPAPREDGAGAPGGAPKAGARRGERRTRRRSAPP